MRAITVSQFVSIQGLPLPDPSWGIDLERVVDVWSGNHPFYLGDRSSLVAEASQVEKFRQKYPDLKDWLEIPVLKGKIKLPPRRRPTKPGKKK